jgi:large repetitive protein
MKIKGAIKRVDYVLYAIFLSLICIAGQSNSNAQVVIPAAGYINTIAGSGSIGSTGDGGLALLADFKYPTQAVVDSLGNIYIADYGNNRIQKVTASSGLMSTYAGTGTAGSGGVPGVATSAGLSSPYSLALDGANNLYISDYGNNRILKVNTSGQISLVAGTGVAGYSGDTKAAINAELNGPYGIAADSAGDVFIVDHGNFRIREVNTSGIINTVAGNGTSSATRPANDANALTSSFDQPYAVAVDSAGNLYISDHGTSTIYKVAVGSIYYFAGTGTAGYSGDNVAATSTTLNNPTGLSVDAWGNLFFADSGNNRIREINTSGIITTVAGNGTMAFLGDKGLATNAEVAQPSDVRLDTAGNLYIDDYSNERIRAVGVVKATPTVGLSLSPTSVVYGAENATFSATVPTGSSTVTFSNGSGWTSGAIAVTGGTVTSSISNATWAAGSYTISAAYAGNSEYQAVTPTATFTVTKASPTLSVTSSGLTASYGSSVTFTATISAGATGSITFLDSGSSIGTGTIGGTTATFTTTTLAVGTHTITASYAATTDFNAVTSTSITQTVTKATPTLSVTSSGTPAAPGASVKFTATISSGPTGTITFYDSGTSIGTGTISGTTATFSTTTLALGSHSITAGYAGSTDYNSVTSIVFTQAILATPTLSVATSATPTTYGTSVTFTATISAGPTGSITFYDSGTSIGTGAISSGKATLAISTLSAGTHSITAGFAGNPDYAQVTSSAISQVVNKATPTIGLVSSTNPSSYGASVTFTAALSSGPTGTVTFKAGSTTLGTGTISGTQATFTTTALALGTSSIAATYAGNTNYNTVTSSAVSQVVNKDTPTITLTSSANPAAYGSSITLTASISNGATGTITFYNSGTSIGTGTISAGVASLSISSLALGSHSMTAGYASNTDYNAATSNTVTQNILTQPTLVVSTSGSPSASGASVTFTATISSGPTGTVTFYDSGTSIGTGTISGTTATLQTSTLALGNHTITASWPGNPSYMPVTSSPISQSVLATPTLSVVSSLNPATYGSNVTFTATISSGPTGNILFFDGSTQIGQGAINATTHTATFATNSFAIGAHSVTAQFVATSQYYGVTSAILTQNVIAATPTLSISTSGSPSAYGAPVTFTATISSGPTGTITFNVGGSPIGTGTLVGTTATFTTTTLAIGSNSVTASYAATTDYNGVTSAPITQTVTKATPIITWNTPAPIPVGTALTSIGQLNATASLYGSPIAGSFQYNPVAGTQENVAGNFTLTATFSPTDTTHYATPPNATVTLTVLAIPVVSFSVASGPPNSTFTITGANLGASGTVTFNGTAATTVWGVNSITVTVPSTLSAGNYSVVVAVDGVAPSAPTNFLVTPQITSLSIPQGPATMGLVITGLGFGTVQGNVQFGTTQVITILSWSNTSITVQVPSIAIPEGQTEVSAPIIVNVPDGSNFIPSVSFPFNVVNPFGCTPPS